MTPQIDGISTRVLRAHDAHFATFKRVPVRLYVGREEFAELHLSKYAQAHRKGVHGHRPNIFGMYVYMVDAEHHLYVTGEPEA